MGVYYLDITALVYLWEQKVGVKMYPHDWRLGCVFGISEINCQYMVVTREGKRREKLGGGREKCRDFGGRIMVGLGVWVLCVAGGVLGCV